MNFIKDSECTPDTPVILGKQEKPIYGDGVRLKPRVKVDVIQNILRKSIYLDYYRLKNMI